MRTIIRDSSGRLMLRLKILGCYFNEQTNYVDSPQNRILLKEISDRVQEALSQGTFDYLMHFPHSKNALIIEALQSRFISPGWRSVPTFESYYRYQFNRYCYVVPEKLLMLIMGCIGSIKIDEVMGYHFLELVKALNTLVGVTPELVQYTIEMVFHIIDCAAICYLFSRPFRFIPQALRKHDYPLTHRNILLITEHLPIKYREFFLLKYYLGVSTLTLINLKWAQYEINSSTFKTLNKSVYVSPYARRLLFQLMKKSGNSKYVFSGKFGERQRFNLAWLLKICWPKACKDAGFGELGACALRRASVAYLFESGLEMHNISCQTGVYHRPCIDNILSLHILNPQE